MITILIDKDSVSMDYTNRFGKTTEIFAGPDVDGEDVLLEAVHTYKCCGAGSLMEALYDSVKAIA
jgi:hypothetical protein